MKKILLILAAVIFLSGWAAPINRQNALDYAKVAESSSKSGDWDAARRQWARTVGNADLGGMDESTRAIYYYEYGRAAGVTCFFDIAEEYLNKAYELDKKIGGPTYLSLNELFRLNLDQKKYNEAVAYFRRALPELEKMNASNETPAEFSKLLEEFSIALDGIGNMEEAKEVRARASKVKEQAEYSITERTPYGLHCESR